MKVIIFFCLTFSLMCSFMRAQNSFSFYKESELYISSPKGEIMHLGSNVKIKKSKKIISSQVYTYRTMPENILSDLNISANMGFNSAIQSPDRSTCLFIERDMESTVFNFCLFNTVSITRYVIFSEKNSLELNYVFMPITYGKSKDIVCLEALIFGCATENEGIWEYNLKTKLYSKLLINSSYLTTPFNSPNAEYFISPKIVGSE